MFSNPDIPDYYQPGGFHILQLGAYVILNKYVGVTFSGQRRHVGTAPTPPPGFPAIESAYRFNAVCYPKDAAVDGLSRFSLASLPGKNEASPKQMKLRDQSMGRLKGTRKPLGKRKGKGIAKWRSKGNVHEEPDENDENEDCLSEGMEAEAEARDDTNDGAGKLKGKRRAKTAGHGKGITKGTLQEDVDHPMPLYITPEMINMRYVQFGDDRFM